jgi:predicted RNA-binding Zn ribbon-like protein
VDGGLLDGGAPLLDEPLAIEFANTRYAVRSRVRDGIATPPHLVGWLVTHAVGLGIAPGGTDRGSGDLRAAVGDAEVAAFQTLRQAIREVARACVEDRPAGAADLAELNRCAAVAPRWPEIRRTTDTYLTVERTGGGPVPAALSAIARDAIRIVGGPLRAELRACPAPGCVLFFIKDHPRREWCSAGCGNRARASRHYHRHRGGADAPHGTGG